MECRSPGKLVMKEQKEARGRHAQEVALARRGEARRRCTQDRDRTGTEVIARHLQGVVEGGAGWVQSEVLEGLDPGLAPALLPAPFHHQHVVRERLPEHQGIAGAGLLSWLLRYLQQQVRSLRKDGTFRCPGIWSQVSKLKN